MSIIETMNTVNEFLLAKAQIIFPGLQMDEMFFAVVVLCAVSACALALYGMIAHPHSARDLADARADGYRSGKEQADNATLKLTMSKNAEIEKLQKALAKADAEARQAVQMLSNVRTQSGDLYRKERIIASLATELDGYSELEDRADRIVDTLN